MGTVTVTVSGFGAMPNGKGTTTGSLTATMTDTAFQELLYWAFEIFPKPDPLAPDNRTNLQVQAQMLRSVFDGWKAAVSKRMKDKAAEAARTAAAGIDIT